MIVHFTILALLLILNLIPENKINRKKYILPLSFFIVFIYWAIRYDYGLDYWNYYDTFYSDINENRAGFGEIWFYRIMRIFKHYYQWIIASSALIVITLYHLVIKYIPQRWYWLFFLLLFIVPDFHFNLISAQRSTMAACILLWAFDLFYIQRKRWLFYIGMVFIAAMFHTSALVFIIVPFFDLIIPKLSGRTIFIILVLSNVASLFSSTYIFEHVVRFFDIFNDYNYYFDVVGNRSLTSMLSGFLVLIPCWFICDNYKRGNKVYDAAFTLALLYLIPDFLHVNFQGRYTVYLYIFFVIVLCTVLEQSNRQIRWFILIPYLFDISYGLYWYYWMLLSKINFEYSSGNMYYYHTIFEAPFLP